MGIDVQGRFDGLLQQALGSLALPHACAVLVEAEIGHRAKQVERGDDVHLACAGRRRRRWHEFKPRLPEKGRKARGAEPPAALRAPAAPVSDASDWKGVERAGAPLSQQGGGPSAPPRMRARGLPSGDRRGRACAVREPQGPGRETAGPGWPVRCRARRHRHRRGDRATLDRRSELDDQLDIGGQIGRCGEGPGHRLAAAGPHGATVAHPARSRPDRRRSGLPRWREAEPVLEQGGGQPAAACGHSPPATVRSGSNHARLSRSPTTAPTTASAGEASPCRWDGPGPPRPARPAWWVPW